jgi:porin
MNRSSNQKNTVNIGVANGTKLLMLLGALFVSQLFAGPALAQDLENCDESGTETCTPATVESARFGGPDAVENQILEDIRQHPALIETHALDEYFAFKNQLTQDTGISFGVDYNSVMLSADASSRSHYGSGGVLRLFGSWDLINRGGPDSGALVWKAEHRHAYSMLAPKDLSFGIGYAGIFEPTFSDEGWRLSNLYWRQRMFGGRATVTAGFLDTSDYVDAFAMGSPWQHFMNFAFSTGSATIGLPNDATLGIAGGVMLTDNLYAIAGITDANAVSTDPFEGLHTAFKDGDYFTSLELGWTSAKERLIFDNVHATLWHTDGSESLVVAPGWGVAFSATTYIDDQLLLFLRGGYADGGGSLLGSSVSVGFGYQPVAGSHLLGVGLNWGKPNETTFAPNLNDQWTAEAFYRIQVTEHLAITPDVQVIFNPALNPAEDIIGVFGLRARLAL